MLDIIKEFWMFMRERKKFWMLPIIIILVLLGVLILLTANPIIAPFIYPIL